MKIAMRRGHQKTGADGCASGIVNEIDVANSYYKKAMAKFKALGHNVLDCTPPEASRSLSNSLWYGINKANNWGADLFISCHANNAYDTYNGAIGCEVIHHKNSTKGKQYAVNVEKELVNLGFKSRGAKADVRGLAEINNTNCPCIIIEPLFVEATEDVAVYKKVGGEGIANAIVKGITNKTVDVIDNDAKEEKKVENIVVYNNYVDKRAAEYLGDYLHCPCIAGNNPFDFSQVNNVYAVGAGEFTSYAKKHIGKGKDRWGVIMDVLRFCKKI